MNKPILSLKKIQTPPPTETPQVDKPKAPPLPPTPKKSDGARRQEKMETLALLQREFPRIFPMTESELLPLALGIHRRLRDELLRRALPKELCSGARISKAIGIWEKQQQRYRELLLAPGTPRIDFDGSIVGSVTESEADAYRLFNEK